MIITNNTSCEMCISEEESFLFEEGYGYIYIVQLNKSDETVINSSKIKLSETDKINFNFNEDGYFTIARVKIPTSKNMSYPNTYYYNKDDNKFYDGDTDLEIDLQTVVDAAQNVEDTEDVIIEFAGFFSTCKLRKCFVTLCKKILNSGVFAGNKCVSKVSSDLIYQRDLVWSVYNTIQYMLDFGQYMEAQRLIERVNVCPGICHGIEKENGGGCGCAN